MYRVFNKLILYMSLSIFGINIYCYSYSNSDLSYINYYSKRIDKMNVVFSYMSGDITSMFVAFQPNSLESQNVHNIEISVQGVKGDVEFCLGKLFGMCYVLKNTGFSNDEVIVFSSIFNLNELVAVGGNAVLDDKYRTVTFPDIKAGNTNLTENLMMTIPVKGWQINNDNVGKWYTGKGRGYVLSYTQIGVVSGVCDSFSPMNQVCDVYAGISMLFRSYSVAVKVIPPVISDVIMEMGALLLKDAFTRVKYNSDGSASQQSVVNAGAVFKDGYYSNMGRTCKLLSVNATDVEALSAGEQISSAWRKALVNLWYAKSNSSNFDDIIGLVMLGGIQSYTVLLGSCFIFRLKSIGSRANCKLSINTAISPYMTTMKVVGYTSTFKASNGILSGGNVIPVIWDLSIGRRMFWSAELVLGYDFGYKDMAICGLYLSNEAPKTMFYMDIEDMLEILVKTTQIAPKLFRSILNLINGVEFISFYIHIGWSHKLL